MLILFKIWMGVAILEYVTTFLITVYCLKNGDSITVNAVWPTVMIDLDFDMPENVFMRNALKFVIVGLLCSLTWPVRTIVILLRRKYRNKMEELYGFSTPDDTVE